MECVVLDGVLPLRDHQQGYGGTQAVYLVKNTQDKQVYFQHIVIARGTVIMRAEGETEKFMIRYSPHPNSRGVARGGGHGGGAPSCLRHNLRKNGQTIKKKSVKCVSIKY